MSSGGCLSISNFDGGRLPSLNQSSGLDSARCKCVNEDPEPGNASLASLVFVDARPIRVSDGRSSNLYGVLPDKKNSKHAGMTLSSLREALKLDRIQLISPIVSKP